MPPLKWAAAACGCATNGKVTLVRCSELSMPRNVFAEDAIACVFIVASLWKSARLAFAKSEVNTVELVNVRNVRLFILTSSDLYARGVALIEHLYFAKPNCSLLLRR
jgi:hypothetical protein